MGEYRRQLAWHKTCLPDRCLDARGLRRWDQAIPQFVGQLIAEVVDDAKVRKVVLRMHKDFAVKRDVVEDIRMTGVDSAGIHPGAPGGRKIGGKSRSAEASEYKQQRKDTASHNGERSRATLR